MDYILCKRFKGVAICGYINLPALTNCKSSDGLIYSNNLPLCSCTSENAHQYFARNDDKHGLERGRLTQKIQKKLAKRDRDYQKRWDIIWADKTCLKYKRPEHFDFWLWNHDFFNADIDELRYIANLIGIKEVK